MTEEKGLETLQVWQKAMTLAVKVQREILPLFPSEEKWALSSQLRRAVQSIAGNIAEGYGRYYYQDSVRSCYIARGSLEETYTYLSMAFQLGYYSENILQSLDTEIVEIRRMLNGYITFLKKSKRGENEPGILHLIKDDPADITGYATPDDSID